MKLFYFSLLTLLGLCFFGCSKKPSHQKTKPLVVVSVSPYDTFVKKIGGDFLDVKAAVPSNFNSHLFEPTPNQLEGFDQCSIWFGISEPFEKKLLLSLKNHNPNLIAVDLSNNLNLPTSKGPSQNLHSCNHHHNHDHDHGHEMDHEGEDRHYWTDPLIALQQSEIIFKILAKSYPEMRNEFEKNFHQLKNEFILLDQDCTARLKNVKGKALIISHPSLGYFCNRYNLTQLSLECEGKTPLPEDITKILQVAKHHPILCVFAIEQFDNKGAVSISRHLKLPLYTINTNNPNYFKNFTQIAKDLSKGSHEK